MISRILYLIIILFLFSCSKEKLGPQCLNCNETEVQPQSLDVLIINEGTFNFTNGSVSLYQPEAQTVNQNVFQQKNSLPLGDVIQSAYQFNDKAYIVVNNSNKIEIADLNNLSSLATITGFTSPRYFLPINNNTAYVTDLYSSSIQIVDLNSNTITGNIPVSGWTEELLIHDDTVYVCDVANDNLLIINPNNNTLVDSVKLGESPNSIVIDQNNKIWIMCSGGLNSTTPKLIKFNPQTRTTEAVFTFTNISESPSSLKINSEGNQLYFINSHVYKMTINDSFLPSSPFISSNNNIYYGLGINPVNEEIYVSDAIDYVQSGIIFRYSNTGALIHQFNSGIIPRDFLFIQ